MKQRETPNFVIWNLLADINFEYNNLDILEPFAGDGKIIKELQKYSYNSIDAVELNQNKYNNIVNNNFRDCTVYHNDYLKFIPNKLYDCIIAAPPFKNNEDLLHIMKMYNELKPHGIIVSLTSPYWLTNNEPTQILFRKWLADNKIAHSLYMLPDKTFIEKDKSIPTAILIINN